MDRTISLSIIIIPMASNEPPVRVGKHKRTRWKARALVEGDDLTLDTAMFQNLEEGTSHQKVLVPIRLDETTTKQPTPMNESGPRPKPEPIPGDDIQMAWDCHEEFLGTQAKTKTHYMKQFVLRIDTILASIQAREAIPESNICSGCHLLVGKWRCQDCNAALPMCRKCM